MASLMLEEELRFYMQRGGHGGKRAKGGAAGGGKSRDALFRSNNGQGVGLNNASSAGSSAVKNTISGQQYKGIAGLSTQGVSLKN